MIVGVPGADEGPGRDGSAGSSIFSLKSETIICDILTLRPEQNTSFVAVTQSFNHRPANYRKPTTPFNPAWPTPGFPPTSVSIQSFEFRH
jgi:hypothetical protein